MLPKILANFETSLASKISDTDTTLTLVTGVDDDGGTLSGDYILTIDEGTNLEEHILVTLSGASGSGATRGLSRVDMTTSKTANKHEHDRGASVKITNASLLKVHRALDGDETIDADLAFNSNDITGVNSIDGLATPNVSETTKAANVQYVIDTALAGATDASDANKGVAKLSVSPVSPTDPIAVGDNDPRVPTADENNALAGTSGTPTTANPYVTQNDTTNGATITAATIAFVDSDPDTITDSGSGFVTAEFQAGQSITVSGSASNDGTYTIASVVAGTITLESGDSLTAESAGATVTISAVEENKCVRTKSDGRIDQRLISSSFTGAASETIDASTNPVPVFLASSDDSTIEIIQEQTSSSGDAVVYGSNWIGQTFTTSDNENLVYGIELRFAADDGNPGGNTEVHIYATSAGEPTGASLGSISKTANTLQNSYQYFEFASPISVSSATQYAIVVTETSSNNLNHNNIYVDTSSPSYTGGTYVTSADSGSTWSIVSGTDMRFRVVSGFSPDAGVQLSGASNAGRSRFLGFALNNASATEDVVVQTDGVVSGFSGLTAGSNYYVQDTNGTIGTTKGTNTIYVGKAISTTSILIGNKTNYLGSAFDLDADTAEKIYVPASFAETAEIDITVSDSANFTGSVTIKRDGKTVSYVTFTDTGSNTDTFRISATWSGEEITLASLNDAPSGYYRIVGSHFYSN